MLVAIPVRANVARLALYLSPVLLAPRHGPTGSTMRIRRNHATQKGPYGARTFLEIAIFSRRGGHGGGHHSIARERIGLRSLETAILAGLFVIAGVLVGGMLQIEAARRAQLGDQQLQAATEFQVAATAFFTALERRARALDIVDVTLLTTAEKEAWLASSRASVDAARDDVRTMLALLARIELVFGLSAASRHAGEAIGHVHELLKILDDVGQPRGDEFAETWKAAIDSFGEFRRCAYEAFSRPVWHWRSSAS